MQGSLANCMHDFNRYTNVNEIAIGVGTIGVIYEVFNENLNRTTVVKAQPYISGYSDGEIFISCKLGKIDGFIKFHRFWICNEIPQQWMILDKGRLIESGRDYNAKQTEYYIEMDKYHGSLFDLISVQNLSLNDRLSIIFELIYALRDAYNFYKFCHGDIKSDNILYNIVNDNRCYILENGDVITIMCPYKPVWTDFGQSEFNSTNLHTDLSDLYHIISQDMQLEHENNSEFFKIFSQRAHSAPGFEVAGLQTQDIISYDIILSAKIFKIINQNFMN